MRNDVDAFSADPAEFRADLRAWIDKNAPAGLTEVIDWTTPGTPGGQRVEPMARATEDPLYREWDDRLLAAGLICPQWPREVGGRGWDAQQMIIFVEECFRAGVPRVDRGMGESVVGPSIIGHGTDEQKAYFLPRIISGEDRYCQGFSEPDFGSDLAGARTRGTVEGAEIVIYGHKIWTSYAARANRIFILCRTDPDAPKHRGLSYVIADFSPDNGIDARPIRDMAGGQEFYEEFIDAARAPLFNVIGGLNNGWRVAMTTLGNERSGRAAAQQLAREGELADLIETARRQGRTTDAAVRQQLAWAYSQVQLLRWNRYRMLTPDGDRVAATWKLAWTEYHARLGEIAVGILGPAATLRPDCDGYLTDRWQDVFLASRSGIISGGTSEIQRNLLAERSLGLPRDPASA